MGPSLPKVKPLTNAWIRERPLGDLLREAHRALVVHLEQVISRAGYDDIGAPHVSVLATVDAGGTRQVELAARGGRTKQATAELCATLTHRGYLELRPDPTDRRAKLYFATAPGRHLLDACQDVVVSYEAWLTDVIGADGIERFRSTLTAIIDRPAQDLARGKRNVY